MLKRLRAWKKRRSCRKHGHLDMCIQQMIPGTQLVEHSHVCLRCIELLSRSLEPMTDPAMTRLLQDLGVPTGTKSHPAQARLH